MKILVTSSRMPYAVGMVRKLAEAGHTVYASDAYELAPGSHSKYLAGHFVTGSPRDATEQFVDDVERIATENEIELIVPSFEEVFYLATQRDRLEKVTRLYAPPFETLARVHDKATFQALTDKLGIRTPETLVARSDDELREHIERFPRYFARAAFSRGGVALLTNTGPLAGHVAIDDCHPTPESPWLVTGVRRRADAVHLHDDARRQGDLALHLPGAAPVGAQHRDRVRVRGRHRDARDRLDHRRRPRLHGPDVARLRRGRRDPLHDRVQPPRDGRAAARRRRTTSHEGLIEDERDLTMVPPGEEVQLSMAVFGQMFDEGLPDWPRSIHDLANIRDATRAGTTTCRRSTTSSPSPTTRSSR